MAIDGYTELDISDCIDSGKIEATLSSLAALKKAAERGQARVICDPVSGTVSGSTRDGGEQCVELVPQTNAGVLQGTKESCIYLMVFKFQDTLVGSPDGRLEDIEITATFKCGDRVIGQQSTSPGLLSAVTLQANCDIGENVTVCTEISYRQTGVGQGDGGGDFWINYDFTICGGRVCIREFDASPDCWIPCVFDEGCCYGMEALSLIVSAVNALCAAYSFGGQAIRCEPVETLNDIPEIVSPNMVNDTTWIAFGALEVCYENFDNVDRDDSYTVRPVVGCESRQSDCIPAVIRPKGSTVYSVFADACQLVPVLSCGLCKAGDTLTVGINQKLECNGVEPDAQPPNVAVTGDWCVWLFEDLSNDFGNPIPRIPKCLNSNYLREIELKAPAIHEAACLRVIPNATPRNIILEGAPGADILIQPALPLPDPLPDPLPVPWPPLKKWTIFGRMRICHSEPPTFNLEDRQIANANYEIKCGGAVIKTGANCPWVLTNSGQFTPCSDWFGIVSNVECDITQPLTICGTVVVSPGGQSFDFEIQGELTAICF